MSKTYSNSEQPRLLISTCRRARDAGEVSEERVPFTAVGPTLPSRRGWVFVSPNIYLFCVFCFGLSFSIFKNPLMNTHSTGSSPIRSGCHPFPLSAPDDRSDVTRVTQY